MSDTSLDPQLIKMLRCPVALKNGQGDDPGKLELINNAWLVCNDNGYKYPIVDGIPVMLPEEGAHWKDVAIADLPNPPIIATEDNTE